MLCPKCQRPLDDESDGSHICCADASLQWRCEQCAEVSEGFAFAYGRCPHCGGKLDGARWARRATDRGNARRRSHRVRDRARRARVLPARRGRQHRSAAASRLFGRFALMEGEHMETLSRRYHLDVPLPSPAFRRRGGGDLCAGRETGRRTRPTCFASRSGWRTARHTSSARAPPAPSRIRPSSSCTANWRPRSASTPASCPSSTSAGAAACRGCSASICWAPRRRRRKAAARRRPRRTPPRCCSADAAAQRTALVCGDATLSYGELRDTRGANGRSVWRARGIAGR